MTTQILDEIIDNAADLPVESLNLLLMMAKDMRHRRDYIRKQEDKRNSK